MTWRIVCGVVCSILAISATWSPSLLAQTDDGVATSFRALHASVEAIVTQPNGAIQGAAQVAAWVDSHNLSSLSPSDVWWLAYRLKVQREGWSDKDFSVTWRGVLTIPATGDYKFSTHPYSTEWDLYPLGYCHHTFALALDGREVLRATGNEWGNQSPSFSLVAGQKMAVEVSYSFSRDGDFWSLRFPVAVLFWEGPGILKSLVPSSAFTLDADQSESGLRATYRSGSVVEGRIEPQVSSTWFTCTAVLPQFADQLRAAGGELVRQLTSDAYVSSTAQHPLIYDEKLLEYLTPSQQKAFIATVTDRPEMLAQADWDTVLMFYHFTRYFSPDGAVELLGQWSQAHPNAEPVFITDLPQDRFLGSFEFANTYRYRRLIHSLKAKDFDYIRLRDEFLVLRDGSLSLPLAYGLAYPMLVSGQIGEWIAFLEARLGQSEVVGERRVNWLLARAHAEEIRWGSPSENDEMPEKSLAGMRWLEEASEVAETEGTKLRLLKEFVTRFAMFPGNNWAENYLAEHEGQMTSATSREQISTWRRDIAFLREAYAQRVQAGDREKAQARAAGVSRLLAEAEQRGESTEASRLSAILSSLNSPPPQ